MCIGGYTGGVEKMYGGVSRGVFGGVVRGGIRGGIRGHNN